MRARKSRTDEDAIPAFLRRKPGRSPTTTETPPPSVGRYATAEDARLPPPPDDLPPLPPGLRWSETVSEEGGHAQRPGVLIRRWADPAYVEMKRREHLEWIDEQKRRANADVERKRANVERLRKLAARPRVPEGHLRLRDAIEKTGVDISQRHAKAAIDASNLVHQNYLMPSSALAIAQLRNVLERWQPPIKRGKHEHDPAAVVVVRIKKNPKKEGTGAHARWALLLAHGGKTVATFVAAGGNQTTLANAIKKGRVELETEKSHGVVGSDESKVQGKDGQRVRGQEKEADQVAPRERDRGAVADGAAPAKRARRTRRKR